MYKKDYVSLYNENKEIKFPNWLIREIGTIKSNIKWNGNKIIISDKLCCVQYPYLNKIVKLSENNHNIQKI